MVHRLFDKEDSMKNKHQHNDDGTTHIFVESKSKYFPGKHTIIIDTEDWDKVKEHTWCIKGNAHTSYPYAITGIDHPDGGLKKTGFKRRTNLRLHHLIVGKPPRGTMIDHIEHNGLDNRKENLRFVTNQQNQQNSRSSKNSSSKYKGVSWSKARKIWYASIMHERKSIAIGRFTCEHEAALAYNKKAVELWGENALLNKVEKQ